MIRALPRPHIRLAQVIVVVAAAWIAWSLLRRMDLRALDMDAYWNAALRLREGGSLYDSGTHGSQVYRYAPWFAFLWIPLTYLPKMAVEVAWQLVLLVAAGLAVWPLARTRDVALGSLALVIGSMLVYQAAYGNVHGLMLLPLVYWPERRWLGPMGIALAASLKGVPLLFAVVYVARREWGRAIVTIVLTVALWAPALLFDLSRYPTGGYSILPLWAAGALVVIAFGLAWKLRDSSLTWQAAALAVIASVPRLNWYEPTYLIAGTSLGQPEPRDDREVIRTRGNEGRGQRQG